jgi:hypothetical protein
MRRRALVGCEMSGRVRNALLATGYWDEVWSADVLPAEDTVMTLVAAEDRWDVPEGRVPEGRHYQGDVRDLFDWYHPVNSGRRRELTMREAPPLWDFTMLHPPCTHLTLGGARYWKQKRATPADWRPGDWPEDEIFSVQDDAASFFMEMVNAPARYVAVENPRGDMTRRYRAPDQYVQPWWFGDDVEKATGWWLKNLPALVPDNPVEPNGRVTTGGGSHRTDMRKNGRSNNAHEDSEGRARRHIVRSRTLPGIARAAAQQWTAFIEEQEKQAA